MIGVIGSESYISIFKMYNLNLYYIDSEYQFNNKINQAILENEVILIFSNMYNIKLLEDLKKIYPDKIVKVI